MQIIEVLTQYSKLNRPFTYFYDGDDLEVGVRVLTNFNNREIVGYVTKVSSTDETIEAASNRLGYELVKITNVLDEKPLLTNELMELSDYVTSYYLTNKISVLNAMLPPSMRPTKSSLRAPKIATQNKISFNPKFKDFEELTTKQTALLNEIISLGSIMQTSANRHLIAKLIEKKAVIIEEVEKYRLQYDDYPQEKPHALTHAQKEAVKTILADDKETFLLHGITGSGKTEVYLALAAHYLAQDKQVIMLVPEIALTGTMLANFYRRFGKKIAILHSELTPAEKYDEYRRIRDGEVDIVVGARSAVFAPLHQIGLIILDEEHSESYKQDVAPFYHAMTVAQMRAKNHSAKIVVGSATPSIETMARAKKEVYGYYFLSERINLQPLPETTIVNMLDYKNITSTSPYISKLLASEIKKSLVEKTQVILLVNRRGYATYVSCRECGTPKKCPTCAISLTYHKVDHTLKCHHCGLSFPVKGPCEKCGGTNFSYAGFATQKAEEDIRNMFPDARILRLDSDVSRRDKTPQVVLNKFMKHEADILIGTQMVSKGHDFPLVSLVGVIGTDASLAIPSFRSSERTFQLITQAIGRSGREKIKGKAIIQTMLPDHYVIQHAKNQDYFAFYDMELRQRYFTLNPPFYFLLSITMSHQNEKTVRNTIEILKHNLIDALGEDAYVIGPTATFYPASGKTYNETLIVRYKNYFKIKPVLLQTLSPFKEQSSLYVHINVDPCDI
ncbi:MAG: replication restart helicase PriA [Bacilli bacterium]|jgi:primosomal protein N' (replication factor Y)